MPVLLAATLWASCGHGGYDYPIPVTYQRGAPQAFSDGIKAAVKQLNAALGCNLLAEPVEDHVSDGIFIMYQLDAGGGQAHWKKEDFCSVYVGLDMPEQFYTSIPMHEILHCIGQGHVEVEGDLMYKWVGDNWTIGPYILDLSDQWCPAS